jgi:hypothetical protein
MEQRVYEGRQETVVGDTTREASSIEVVNLKKVNGQLKQLVTELSLKNCVLKKSLNGWESGFEEV